MPDHPPPLAQRPHRATFMVKRMGVIFDEMQGRAPEQPHRHAYYTVLLIEKASGKHVVDYQTYRFGARQVHFVSPGQVHLVHTPERPEGWVITFTREFLAE
ncbi:MAG: AraC family ligand binding domain-containing protein, partial [Saprospiraceae bacterium]|nr:AraC family ligand binding domain-containing protein [Saprospiraceae bacterium]